MNRRLALIALVLVSAPQPALAASLDGASMRWPWALPFAAMLLSIAGGPLVFPRLWHSHYGKIAFGWSVLTLAAVAAFYGAASAATSFVHAMLAEYLSFIVLLFALYVVAGGNLRRGHLRRPPPGKTALVATRHPLA